MSAITAGNSTSHDFDREPENVQFLSYYRCRGSRFEYMLYKEVIVLFV